MCLIFFAVNHHPTYKLIIAANRDEFYQRHTEEAHFWSDHPDVVGGRDLEAMGTWMGMTRQGRISMLTNYRDPQHINPAAPSRGQLVSDYLIGPQSAPDYLAQVAQHGTQYNGFNLIAGTVDALWYYSNYSTGVQRIPDGLHGLSNHLLNTPWPKVSRGLHMLRPILGQPTIHVDQLFDVLNDEQRAADDQLPNTGLTLDRERALSSMFIKTPNYGTRCSTVVLVDYDNQVLFTERVYDLQTFRFTTQTYPFATIGS